MYSLGLKRMSGRRFSDFINKIKTDVAFSESVLENKNRENYRNANENEAKNTEIVQKTPHKVPFMV